MEKICPHINMYSTYQYIYDVKHLGYDSKEFSDRYMCQGEYCGIGLSRTINQFGLCCDCTYGSRMEEYEKLTLEEKKELEKWFIPRFHQN